MRKTLSFMIVSLVIFVFAESVFAQGQIVAPKLWIMAVINTEEKGSIEAKWHKGGEDFTNGGDQVVWGYFYADPSEVNWGSGQNPELFVKIWFDRSGRVDINFFHVSVPDIEVYSDYPYNGVVDRLTTTTVSKRYARHYYQDGLSHAEERDEDGNSPVDYLVSGNPSGYFVNGVLRLGARIRTAEKGSVDAQWHKGGMSITAGGHRVLWGYFYAHPYDVGWGNPQNPELFVKIWFDVSGRTDVNFFHVSVPDIEVYSALPVEETYVKTGASTTANRYVRHVYETGEAVSAPVFPDENLEAVIRTAINNPVSDIRVSDLQRLHGLDASDKGIRNLEGLQYCSQLTRLELGYNEISDISPISALDNLRDIDLSHNRIRDIGPIENLANLTGLNLSYNSRLVELEPLSQLTSLTWLGLNHIGTDDITPLSGLANLGALHLEDNGISDIGPLARLTNLGELNLCCNKVTNTEPLAKLANLASLNLSHNLRLNNLRPLSQLTSLKWLGLNNIWTNNFGPLSGLSDLEILYLESNGIDDLAPFSELLAVRELYLSDNSVRDIRDILGLTNLESLHIHGNPLNEDSCKYYIPILERDRIKVYSDCP